MDITTIRQLISQSQAVSFDLFDTLIVRLFRKPTDLFAHLEESTQATGFQSARIAAEQEARSLAAGCGVHEVTLDEIYTQLHPSYQPLRQKELALERLMCQANPEMQEVFRCALESGKPVFIASDMYLPREVVTAILEDAGYQGYQKLLLSSETRRPKATGEMYEDLIAVSGLEAGQILHIGDHPYTDGQAAREKGLQTYSYTPLRQSAGNNRNSAYFAVLNRYAEQEPAASILEGLVTAYEASQPAHTYWESFGYKYTGILAYGYMKWLKERLDHLGITRVYFMLRDGFVLKRVFDRLFPQFETYEIYGSRRLFLFAGMRSYRDIQLYITGLHTKGITYAQFWDRLSLEDEAFHARYLEAFPMQAQRISSEGQLRELDAFMEAHEADLLAAGREERAALAAYFQQIDLLEGPAAIVDLGWKGSMLRGLENVCHLLGRPAELTGFFLGTHTCNTPGLRVESYLLDHGHATGARNAKVLLEYGYIVPILESAFSAPHQSILKLKQQDGEMIPIYQDSSAHEEARSGMCRQVLDGILAFAADMGRIETVFPLPISREAALAPMEYLSRSASKPDQVQIQMQMQMQSVCPGLGNDSSNIPILRQGRPVIGVVNPWPGDMSAESEVLARLKRAAEENGIGYVMLDNFGHLLDEHQRATSTFVDADDVSFILTTHYETAKVLDAFHYHTLWNPPEIPLNLDYYTQRVTNQYLMNEDFLIYDAGGMSNHLKGMLLNCPRTLEGASSLTASFPLSAMLAPRLESPTMFYCGMNWEKTIHGSNRHEGLFKLLDRTGKVKFFGPEVVEAWGGLRPWEGYQCYQYSIPFDGFSILEEINQCGICLVLSSDIHRRAGSATNRTYEACAAGAVIISDDNAFMLKYFSDAALFITYNRNNPQDTFRQIMEKYSWIISHREEALVLARRAQQIFAETFALDIQLKQIVAAHPARFTQVAGDLYAKDDGQTVLVTYVLNTQEMGTAKAQLDSVFRNIHRQLYRTIQLAIAADLSICQEVQSYCLVRCACAQVVPMALFDKKGARSLTDGQAVRRLQKQVAHTYSINTNAEEIWFFDHITAMARQIEDTGAPCAYSGSAYQDCHGYRRVNFFEKLGTSHLFYQSKPERPLMPGQFLFHADAHALLPDYLFDCLDGGEHLAYAGILHYKYGQMLAFSRRMSFCFTQEEKDTRSSVLPAAMQTRFIQDLVRLDLPEQGPAEGTPAAPVQAGEMRRMVADGLLIMPLKNLIRLRFYRMRMRKLDPGGERYQALNRKYNAVLKQYEDFWGI